MPMIQLTRLPTFLSTMIACLSLIIPTMTLTSARSAELPHEPMLPLNLAIKAVQASVEKCSTDGYQVSTAVVDQGGNLRAMLRQDGAGPHTVDSSRKKAYTAASLKRPTAEFASLIVKVPEIQALQEMNDQILLLAGGLPIEINGVIVGGIGVGGAPGGHLDVACAQAGLKSIGATMTESN